MAAQPGAPAAAMPLRVPSQTLGGPPGQQPAPGPQMAPAGGPPPPGPQMPQQGAPQQGPPPQQQLPQFDPQQVAAALQDPTVLAIHNMGPLTGVDPAVLAHIFGQAAKAQDPAFELQLLARVAANMGILVPDGSMGGAETGLPTGDAMNVQPEMWAGQPPSSDQAGMLPVSGGY